MFICASQSTQNSQEIMFEKTVLYGPLGGDTAPKVVTVFPHASSQHNYTQRCTL